MGLTQRPVPDPISRSTTLTASQSPSRSSHLVAEEEVAALVCKLPEALGGAGRDDDGEVVAIRTTEQGLVAGAAQGLGPGAASRAQQQEQESQQQQHAACSQGRSREPGGGKSLTAPALPLAPRCHLAVPGLAAARSRLRSLRFSLCTVGLGCFFHAGAHPAEPSC